MANEPLLVTTTGESFQPVRLHYKILNRSGLRKAFEKLRCLNYDPDQKRWVWLYAHEAKKLRFKYSYEHLPKEHHPIVIGAFFVRTNDTLLLDLRSCERALLAIPFFDSNLSRKLVKLVEADIVNQLFPATQANLKLTPGAIFDSQTSVAQRDYAGLVRRLTQKTADVEDLEEKQKIVLEDIRSQASEPLPKIERFPVHYEEDGIGGFKLALQVRQLVAMQHWMGNHAYTLDDAIQSAL